MLPNLACHGVALRAKPGRPIPPAKPSDSARWAGRSIRNPQSADRPQSRGERGETGKTRFFFVSSLSPCLLPPGLGRHGFHELHGFNNVITFFLSPNPIIRVISLCSSPPAKELQTCRFSFDGGGGDMVEYLSFSLEAMQYLLKDERGGRMQQIRQPQGDGSLS